MKSAGFVSAPARDDGRACEPAHIVKRFASAEQLTGARCKNKK